MSNNLSVVLRCPTLISPGSVMFINCNDAISMLSLLRSLIKTTGSATLGDLYFLLGKEVAPKMRKDKWTNLDGAAVVQLTDKFYLYVPPLNSSV